ncbi:VCBS domain-containing protein [Vibrio chagasii]|nr:VCBS domain-containing protein [Vibrio chagasii]
MPEHDITVLINGTNDAPVIGTGVTADAEAATEDTSF